MPAEDPRGREGRIAGRVLAAGSRLSGACMAAGVILAAAGRGEGRVVALAGIIALVATPFIRVAFLAGDYFLNRQWRMLAVSLSVLALLATGVLLGLNG